MNDDQLIRDLRGLDRPVEVDPRFADRLFERLLEERRPRRRRPPMLLMAATLLIGGVAIGAVVVGGAQPRSSEAPIVQAPVHPSVVPVTSEPTAGLVETPIDQTWIMPGPGERIGIRYAAPADLEIVVARTGDYLAFTAGTTTPVGLDGTATTIAPGARGVKVANVAGTTVHYNNDQALGLDAASLMEGIRTNAILGADLGPVTTTSLDGRPALTADLRGTTPEAHLDRDGASFDLWPPSRIILADTPGGGILMVQIWAGAADDLRAWLPDAQRLVASFRLVETTTEPTPTPLPTTEATPVPSVGTFRAIGRDAFLKVVVAPELYFGRGYRFWACITQYDASTGPAQVRAGVWFERAKDWRADGEGAYLQGTETQLAAFGEGDVVIVDATPIGSGLDHSPSGMASAHLPVFRIVSIERRGTCRDQLPIGNDQTQVPPILP